MRHRSGRETPERPRTRWRPRLTALAGALALALAVAACGGAKAGGVASLGGSRNPTTTTNASSGQDLKKAALEFAKCMRQHDIDMPDPQFSGSGGEVAVQQQGPTGVRPDDPKFKAAQEACKKYMPKGGQPARPNPQQQQQALKFARCMRAHGIDMPDPQPGGGGLVMRGGGSGGRTGNGPGPDDPKFKAAQQACQQYMPKGGLMTKSAGGGG
jgi:hypothetical protein